jgi:DNA-binding MarR family transcriptional regulator
MYMSQDKPIGWWLKDVDRALEESFAAALAGEGVDRRQWQLLNVAAAGGATDALAPFFADPAEADAPVRALVERGWVRSAGDTLTLTAAGSAARDRLLVVVREQRARTMHGIDPAEYAATVDVLRRMAANLAAG